MRRRRRAVHSAAMRVSTSASWLGPAGWNWSRKAAVSDSSSAGSSPRMMWDAAWIPDFRALREEAALPSGEVGPVDFLEFRRLASICAWEDMLGTSCGVGVMLNEGSVAPVLLPPKHEGAEVSGGRVDGCYLGNEGWEV